MNENERKIFAKFKREAYDKVEANDIMPHLVPLEAMGYDDLETIEKEGNRYKRMLRLMDVLEKKMEHLSDFMEALRKAHYNPLADKLQEAIIEPARSPVAEAKGIIEHFPKGLKEALPKPPIKFNLNDRFQPLYPTYPVLVLKMMDLDGADGNEIYSGKQPVTEVVYEGNGRNLDKAVAICARNVALVERFNVTITEPLIPGDYNLPNGDAIKRLWICSPVCNLNAESCMQIVNLLKSFPSLRSFSIYGRRPESAIDGIGEIIAALPQTVTTLGIGHIKLPPSIVKKLESAIAQHIALAQLSLCPTDEGIESVSEVVLAARSSTSVNALKLELAARLDPRNEEKLFQALEQWKHLERLAFANGSLNEAGQQCLHDVIQNLNVKQLIFHRFTVPNFFMLRELCAATGCKIEVLG